MDVGVSTEFGYRGFHLWKWEVITLLAVKNMGAAWLCRYGRI